MYWFLTILIIPYLYMLIKIWYGLKRIVKFDVSINPDIFVSIIIPCHNEQKSIPALLNDLSGQLYPSDKFEVIIVDDNSTDMTFDIVNTFKTIANLVVLRTTGKGKKQSLRTGIKISRGDLIITTDADCRVGNKWIKTIASFFSQCSPQLIVCPVDLSGSNGLFSSFQKLEFLSLQGVTAGTIAFGNPAMCNGANLAFTSKTYNEHSNNLYDKIESGDDMFLLTSLKKDTESKILWLESNDACVETGVSENWRSFFRQRSRWFSKWKYYNDPYIGCLSFVVFITNLLITGMLIAGIFQFKLLALASVMLLVKSLPDYLILSNTAKRYKKEYLLKYFVPAQIIYSFYILFVAISSVFWRPKWERL
jgi:biofilm PGA synthesis N-glycosyltransferase PgaC